MNKAYIVLAALLILLGAGLVILPERDHPEEASPRDLLGELREPSRFVTTDEVARMIIEQDPTLLLVDVRDMYDYLDYSLPGAHNIQLQEILLYDWIDSLAYPRSKIVLFSNGDILADQAWILLKRENHKNIHVMKGGLNRWFETIITPEPPAEVAGNEEIDLYQFRKGASIYFTGGAAPVEEEVSAEPVVVRKRTKSSAVEGGC